MKWLWGVLAAGAVGVAAFAYLRTRPPTRRAPGNGEPCAQVATRCVDGFVAPTPCGCSGHGGVARTPTPGNQPETPAEPRMTTMPVQPTTPPPGASSSLPGCAPGEEFRDGRCVVASPQVDREVAPSPPAPPSIADQLKSFVNPQPTPPNLKDAFGKLMG